MPRKRILVKSIDTSISYQVIGIDLAKHLVSACLITGAGEIFGIDRLSYVNFQRFPTLDAKKLVNAPKMSAHHRGICHF